MVQKHQNYTKWCLVVLQYNLGQCLVDSLPNMAFFGNFSLFGAKGKNESWSKTPKIHEMVFGGVTLQFGSIFSRFPT